MDRRLAEGGVVKTSVRSALSEPDRRLVMLLRLRSTSCLRLAAFGAALAFALPISAQQPRVIVGGGHVGVVSTLMTVPISDSAVRRLIESNYPDVLQDDVDAHHVLLVIDANGEYVSGRVSRAAVVTPAAVSINGDSVFVGGDSIGGSVARVVVRRVDSDGLLTVPLSVGGVTVLRASGAGGDPPGGLLGSGYPLSEVSAFGLKRFAAGELGRTAIIVSVIKLK
jgi:hypothetical protein